MEYIIICDGNRTLNEANQRKKRKGTLSLLGGHHLWMSSANDDCCGNAVERRNVQSQSYVFRYFAGQLRKCDRALHIRCQLSRKDYVIFIGWC